MLVVNYNGNKPVSDYFKFSVQGNNDADIVRFVLEKKQQTLDLTNTGFRIYAKCQTPDLDFADKVILGGFQVIGNNIYVDWVLQAKHTANKQLQVSLCFENLESEVVWQTQLFTLTINNGINVAETIENTYPDVLQDLQEQIDNIPNVENAETGEINEALGLDEDGKLVKQVASGGGGGGSTEVEIKKVWLSYDEKRSIRSDFLGLDDDQPFINDSTRIWVNFKTTPINEKMEQEIKNGRFVIRLDYPIRSKSSYHKCYITPLSIKTHKMGAGTRSYTPDFTGGNTEMAPLKKEILLNSLIFVEEEDIKTNAYGEKYIHKKVSFYDYAKNMCSLDMPLLPITQEYVRGDGVDFFYNYLNEFYPIGIPHTIDNKRDPELNEFKHNFSGVRNNKMLVGRTAYFSTSCASNDDSFRNNPKLNPAFSCYCPFMTEVEHGYPQTIYSPYFIGKKTFALAITKTSFLTLQHKTSLTPLTPSGSKKAYMSAKPRCAILNDDYETADKAFLRTYPQATQQINLYCKAMVDIWSGNCGTIPVFRVLITQK